MSTDPPADFNPFEAPSTPIGAGPTPAGPGSEDERTRRSYLDHKSSVRSIGVLCYLAAAACEFVVVAALATIVFQPDRLGTREALVTQAIVAGIAALLSAAFVRTGVGLNRLRPWARWVCLAVVVLATLIPLSILMINASLPGVQEGRETTLVLSGVMTLFCGYLLYLLLSRAGAVVFSPGYRRVIAQTPHMRRGLNTLLKIILGLSLAALLLGIAAIVQRAR